MCVEDTVSFSTSTSGTTRVSNSLRERSRSGSPLALLPKRKFSPTDTCVAPSFSISTSSMNCSADFDGELAVERDRHELLHVEPRDQVALDRRRVEQLRQRLRRDAR